MTAKEKYNRFEEKAEPWRKWGVALGMVILTIYNGIKTPATKEDAVEVKQTQDSAMIYLKEIRVAVVDLKDKQDNLATKVEILQQENNAQWSAIDYRNIQ